MSAGARQNAASSYLEKEIAGLDPMGLILKIYDVAIAGCVQQNPDRVSRALVELIASLNFEHQEVATSLFRMYEYCMRCAKSSQFDEAMKILKDLRQTWTEIPANQARQAG